MKILKRVTVIALSAFAAFGVAACTPGYMKVDDLNRREQGPDHCAARCHELGMEMGAMVLVSNQLPGCVCTPRSAPPPAPSTDVQTKGATDAPQEGAAAATTGYAVVLAAAAAAHQQQMQVVYQQQQQSTQHYYHH